MQQGCQKSCGRNLAEKVRTKFLYVYETLTFCFVLTCLGTLISPTCFVVFVKHFNNKKMCETSIYTFVGCFFKREFKGQSSGPHIYDKTISANSFPDVLDLVMDLCLEHMQREVVFNSNGTEREIVWSTKTRPDKEDIGKYVLFQDKIGKKIHKWTEVTSNTVKNWRNKEIRILIHIHSLSLASSADYEAAKSQLMTPAERCRSGAASVEVVNMLAKRMEGIYYHMDGESIVWKTWANHILSLNPAEQEEAIYRPPPSYVGEKLRLRVPNHRQVVYAHNRMNVARNVNAGYRESINELRSTYNVLFDMFKGLDMKIKALEDRFEMGDTLLTEMETDLRPSESDYSRDLAAQVTDAVDVDHT